MARRGKYRDVFYQNSLNSLRDKRPRNVFNWLFKVEVLSVEDNEINWVVAAEMLANMHLEVDIAENGLVAVDKVNVNDDDLVLMDIQMPEMDSM